MGQSYRIKTELGINKSINVQLDQQFEFLEVLSLTLQQEDIYTKSCAQYGVIVGRVTANNGFGLPNARVSVFIPITSIDESNPIISSIYPYKSPNDKNEDGYRYNLLPYEKSYSSHSATGTLPSRLDSLTGETAVEIYDKYYKYSVKTNDSGDYMIMGVPQGNHSLVMDVDLSDIGEFSLTPQDLIRMGLATDAQVAGNRFRTSTDLNSLPQIINLTKDVEVSPLWGDPELCDIAINRLDFDLRDDANIDIQPTAVFMGSIYSTSDSYRVRPNARPADDMGNLCSLVAGPGQILTIRQTIYQDIDGNPVLEQHQLEQSGNIIDGNGTWLTELPMNLDYFITNEFGEKVLSNDPTVGIPTKAKYRFKIKWQQSPNLSEQVRRPYYLVPNVKEYGWIGISSDPNDNPSNSPKLRSSYYFGLAWSGYTEGFSKTSPSTTNSEYIVRLNEIINCEDTFYEFQFNKVYTVSALIDQFKNGGRGQFIGIKEIDSQDCESTINKFPVNEGFRNFDLLYFVFAIILQIFQIIGIPLLIVYHFLAFLWNNFAVPLLLFLSGLFYKTAVQHLALMFGAIAGSAAFGATLGLIAGHLALFILYGLVATLILINFSDIVSYKFGRLKLPMITYPDCQACECDPEETAPGGNQNEAQPQQGLLTQLSNSGLFIEGLTQDTISRGFPEQEAQTGAVIVSQGIAGVAGGGKYPYIYKSTMSPAMVFPKNNFNRPGRDEKLRSYGLTLPPGERINIYNTRKKYFDNTPTTTTGGPTQGVNRISVTFNYPSNINKFHYDNTLTVFSVTSIEPGTLLTFVNKNLSTDSNYLWSGSSSGYTINGINGIIKSKPFNTPVSYAVTQTTSSIVRYDVNGVNSECFLNLTISAITDGTLTYRTCPGVKIKQIVSANTQYNLYNENGISYESLAGTAEFALISSGETCQRYNYPSDIEYYQVLTAITINKKVVNGQTIYTVPGLGSENYGFYRELEAQNQGYLLQQFGGVNGDGWQSLSNPPDIWKINTSDFFSDFESQTILILQRGIDPYSPLMLNKYGIGKILGHPKENDVIITGMTRMNIPIQPLPVNSPISVQDHKLANQIFTSSYFYTPGIPSATLPGLIFSSYTTSNVGYYGALDASYTTPPPTNLSKKIISFGGPDFYGYGIYNFKTNYGGFNYSYNYRYGVSNFSWGTTNGVSVQLSSTDNIFANPTPLLPSLTKYEPDEDLSGAAYMYRGPFVTYFNRYFIENFSPLNVYFSPILLPQFLDATGSNAKLTINNGQTVMRTDRLPSSDTFDVQPYKPNDLTYLNNSVSLLQQNLSFAAYSFEGGLLYGSPGFSTGAQQVTANIEGQFAEAQLIETMNTCENMVGLNCYKGDGTNFIVEPNCQNVDTVENGCYVMVNRPLLDLTQDFETFSEWGYRFRFFYGLCRGVLSQSFTNNWVNGSLYTFPIQVDTKFNLFGQASSVFAKPLVYFDDKTNNFYYRSSPYQQTTGQFIGRPKTGLLQPVNNRNLLFPTTIVNLGMKDDIYQEIIFEPSTKGYIMKSLNPSSYSDTSDLVNLFVISRITNSGFLTKIISGLNNSLNELFTRDGNSRRIDGDLAQAMSINSEFGVIPFSPQFYNTNENPSPVNVVGYPNNPAIGIFFSSTTFDLQNKDYLSPGIINFRPSNNANAITYQYGIKSQRVPFYQWGLNNGNTIFGSEKNNWVTTNSIEGIFSQNYQSLSRRNPDSPTNPSYFMDSNSQGLGDIYKRGYLFGVDANGKYSNVLGNEDTKFLVGAPNHFYFGIIQGESALDKFKTKYSVDE